MRETGQTANNRDYGLKQCRYCNASLRFLKTRSGKFMPVEADPVKVLVHGSDGYVLKSGYRPHWESCPGADEARRK